MAERESNEEELLEDVDTTVADVRSSNYILIYWNCLLTWMGAKSIGWELFECVWEYFKFAYVDTIWFVYWFNWLRTWLGFVSWICLYDLFMLTWYIDTVRVRIESMWVEDTIRKWHKYDFENWIEERLGIGSHDI